MLYGGETNTESITVVFKIEGGLPKGGIGIDLYSWLWGNEKVPFATFYPGLSPKRELPLKDIEELANFKIIVPDRQAIDGSQEAIDDENGVFLGQSEVQTYLAIVQDGLGYGHADNINLLKETEEKRRIQGITAAEEKKSRYQQKKNVYISKAIKETEDRLRQQHKNVLIEKDKLYAKAVTERKEVEEAHEREDRRRDAADIQRSEDIRSQEERQRHLDSGIAEDRNRRSTDYDELTTELEAAKAKLGQTQSVAGVLGATVVVGAAGFAAKQMLRKRRLERLALEAGQAERGMR
jgi:hypothetical protein